MDKKPEGSENALKDLKLPELTSMNDTCLSGASVLTKFNAPSLKSVGTYAFSGAYELTKFDKPSLLSTDETDKKNSSSNSPKSTNKRDTTL